MIRLHNVYKSYGRGASRNHVLKGITLDLPDGANVGILGRNGSGKSTLLRIIGGIEEPCQGYVTSQKTVSWPVGLGDVGQGSLTGRENAAFVCRIYGLTGSAIGQRVSSIERFADIGRSFDLPVKGYSSGMRSRLGFAISMAFPFQVYLFDELMSVGDVDFRERCSAAIEERRKNSTFIVVSHDMKTLKSLCAAGVYIKAGRVKYFEDIDGAIDAYKNDAPID